MLFDHGMSMRQVGVSHWEVGRDQGSWVMGQKVKDLRRDGGVIWGVKGLTSLSVCRWPGLGCGAFMIQCEKARQDFVL